MYTLFMKPSYYFKIAFFPLTIGIFAFLLVKGLFDIYDNTATIGRVLFKSVFVAVFTGLVMGLLNMIFKKDLRGKKKSNDK